MLLIGVKEENGWLMSRWNLTYRVGWEQICKGIHAVYAYYENAELLVNGAPKAVKNGEEILRLPEAGSMTLRGVSTIIHVPLMLTFMNQSDAVQVAVPVMQGEEFGSADYQSMNLSLGQYMDSIELAMYR